ncbi:hypothetical protein FIBSPDRAFT_887545 [Athelia psychrophila]|uniref:Uncharacterized protein n=1 Tax=Athelia psychrophila TaxID=1759441 RepID=A0A166PK20_9AGAM|nr:hypothetical protein FIBSPDRAFT_887545 [Fibularhizoctonia sp. CBS 109695]
MCRDNAPTALDGLHAEIVHGGMTIALPVFRCVYRGDPAALAAHVDRVRNLFRRVETDENGGLVIRESGKIRVAMAKLVALQRQIETGSGAGEGVHLPIEDHSEPETARGRVKWYRWVHGPAPSVSSPPLMALARGGRTDVGNRRGNSSHLATRMHSARHLAAPQHSGDDGGRRHEREAQGRDEVLTPLPTADFPTPDRIKHDASLVHGNASLEEERNQEVDEDGLMDAEHVAKARVLSETASPAPNALFVEIGPPPPATRMDPEPEIPREVESERELGLMEVIRESGKVRDAMKVPVAEQDRREEEESEKGHLLAVWKSDSEAEEG